MNTQVMTVTPELAKFWLTYNDTNRKVRNNNTDAFVHLIEQGEFRLTHQGMAFEGDKRNPKRLQDGQHRCLAIIKTGQPQQMMVSWNCPPEMFACVDSGAMRNFKDLGVVQENEPMKNITPISKSPREIKAPEASFEGLPFGELEE